MIAVDIKKPLLGSHGMIDLSLQLEIQEGEFILLMGESGSGKTTLLRILAGLESAQGTIYKQKRIWHHDKSILATQKREIGFVFQEYALFPNMTVLENLLFVANDTPLAEKLLQKTQLEKLKDRYPSSLSGGQQQRVAICRAVMCRPKLLLMDEPFSALDAPMRRMLQKEIKSWHKEFGMTIIMVSHDKAMRGLVDRVLVLNHGQIVEDVQGGIAAKKSYVEAEVIACVEKKDAYLVTVFLAGSFIEVRVAKEDAKNISVGDLLALKLTI